LHICQLKRDWSIPAGYGSRFGMQGKRVGIIGLGHTGTELAKRCKAFGMTVYGYRRKNLMVEGIDRLYSKENGDSINELLAECDYICLTVGLNDETYKMIGRSQLAAMKPGAYLINMCRGAVVDEAELIFALQNNLISGAGLDTFAIEPLPHESPLWVMPNVMITPHRSPANIDRWQYSYNLIAENIKRYRNEQPLINQLNISDVYTK